MRKLSTIFAAGTVAVLAGSVGISRSYGQLGTAESSPFPPISHFARCNQTFAAGGLILVKV